MPGERCQLPGTDRAPRWRGAPSASRLAGTPPRRRNAFERALEREPRRQRVMNPISWRRTNWRARYWAIRLVPDVDGGRSPSAWASATGPLLSVRCPSCWVFCCSRERELEFGPGVSRRALAASSRGRDSSRSLAAGCARAVRRRRSYARSADAALAGRADGAARAAVVGIGAVQMPAQTEAASKRRAPRA